MEFKQFVWLLESDTTESYETWRSSHGVFNTIEAVNEYISLHPFSEEDEMYYLEPEQISFYD